MQKRLGKAVTVLALALGACTACSKLTEPATQEPIIQSEQAQPAAAPSPPGSVVPGEPAKPAQPAEGAQAAPAANANAKADKVDIVDLTLGKGAEVKAGDNIRVHYVGKLADGKEFDASRKHSDKGLTFPIGVGRVIKGWDTGLLGMKVGGKRKLTIPPSLGYGAMGHPPVIPPNSTLVFEVELLEVKPK
jgi:FKBP-type peptidyl-prolyl cis-trans isomerase